MKKALLIVCAIVCSAFYASAQESSTAISPEQSKQSTASAKKRIDWSPKYKGEINVGYAISGNRFRLDYMYSDSDGEFYYEALGYKQTVLSRPLIETVHGIEIGPYFFVGAGFGLQYYCGKLKEFQEFADVAAEINLKGKSSNRWNAIMLPIFADIKFMYPVNSNFAPFLNLGIGGTVGCYSSLNCKEFDGTDEYTMKARGGFYCDFGAGIRYKALNFSIGMQQQALSIEEKFTENYEGYYHEEGKISTKINSFYIKVGLNF